MSKSGRFLESVHKMKGVLRATTGEDDPLVEIYLSQNVFNDVLIDFYKQDAYRSTFRPSDVATFEVIGVKIKTK